MAKKSGITNAYETLPKVVKILLQIFLGAFIGGIYRIIRFFETGKVLTLVAGLLTLFTGVGNAIAWVADLVTELLFNRITVLAD
ncbi:MAG: hypothetical protein IJA78_04325 [Clostridia bacterium]|nr:hypothetical protein [Clostridia bacterium]